MIASRITKAFQLIALGLAFTVFNVYVMAGTVRTPTDPRTTDSSTSEKAAPATTGVETASTASVASEKMTVTAGTKTVLNRLFSRQEVAARITANSAGVNHGASFTDTFKSPAKANAAVPQTSDDSDHSGRRSMWIAVGIIAAVVTIAVIGLRHDRNN